MRINGKRIVLRPPVLQDAEQMYAWENAAEVVAVSTHEGGLSLEDIRSYILDIKDIYLDQQARWIISQEGRAMGTLDLSDYNSTLHCANVGILIADPADRRNGYGQEAIELLIGYAAETLGLEKMNADVQVQNEGSQRFFERLDFKEVERSQGVIRYVHTCKLD